MQSTSTTSWLSTAVIFMLLASLIIIMQRCDSWSATRGSYLEFWCIDVCFSVYGGWVTVASILNVAVALKSTGSTNWGMDEEIWACIIAIAAFVIFGLVVWRRGDGAFGLVYSVSPMPLALPAILFFSSHK